jgi:hypothetical protein
MAEGEDQHALIDKLEHDLRSMEFNRPYEAIEIRKLQKKILDLKNEMQESDLAFGQV